MVLKILAWVFGVAAILVVIFFGTIIFRMVGVAQITESKVKKSLEFKLLYDGVVIEEISKDEKPLPEKLSLGPTGTGDLPAGKEMVLYDDGTIVDERRTHDDSPGVEVEILLSETGNSSLVFRKNEVFIFDNFKLGTRIGEYSNPALGIIRHVSFINEKYILIEGDPADATYADSYLWQVERTTLKKEKLAGDIYFSFERPPMVFSPSGFGGVVIVYYTGSFLYAYGGDNSRPKFSVIRIYNNDFPDGKDVAKFGFKAGTIVDVRWENESLILTGDPSRPAMADKPRVPARIWHLQLPSEGSEALVKE